MKKAIIMTLIILTLVICFYFSCFGKTIKCRGGNCYVASVEISALKKAIKFDKQLDYVAEEKMRESGDIFLFHPEKEYFITGVTLDGFVKVRYKGETDEFFTGRNAVGF